MGKIVLIREELILFFYWKMGRFSFPNFEGYLWKNLSKNKKDKELKIIS